MKTSILLILLISATILFAQDQNYAKQSLRFGVNGAFGGTGDLLGKSLYGEYVFPVHEYIANGQVYTAKYKRVSIVMKV